MPTSQPSASAAIRRLPLRLAAVACAATSLLAACGPEGAGGPGDTAPVSAAREGAAQESAAGTPPAPAVYSEYVALGDSYAAVGGTTLDPGSPPFCRRAAANYPALLLQGHRVESGTDTSCQGARIPDLTEPRPTGESAGSPAVDETLPPQLSALTPTTDLVTLSIGGNDIDFGSIAGCFGRSMLAEFTLGSAGGTTAGDAGDDASGNGAPSECRTEFEQGTEDSFAALPAQLDGVYEAIAAASPRATVAATGYIPLIAATDTCAEISAISPQDKEWAAGITGRLNALVREAAERHGALFAEPPGADAHTSCAAPGERWVDFTGADTGSFPMHPTPLGHEAMAAAVEAAI